MLYGVVPRVRRRFCCDLELTVVVTRCEVLWRTRRFASVLVVLSSDADYAVGECSGCSSATVEGTVTRTRFHFLFSSPGDCEAAHVSCAQWMEEACPLVWLIRLILEGRGPSSHARRAM